MAHITSSVILRLEITGPKTKMLCIYIVRRYNYFVIKEWIEYLKTPSTRLAKSKGFVYQSVALKSRSNRLGAAWDEHFTTCADLLLDFAIKHKFKSVLVLGSGHLLETPPETLQYFSRVGLVDMVHSQNVRKIADTNSWDIHEIDLSGEWITGDLARLEDISKNYDFVVSANLLSQISLSLIQNKSEFAEKEMISCLQRHYTFLKNLGRPTLIWSDVEEQHYDIWGDLTAHGNTLPGLTLPKPLKEWTWNFAPAPEIYKDKDVHLKMKAWTLNCE